MDLTPRRAYIRSYTRRAKRAPSQTTNPHPSENKRERLIERHGSAAALRAAARPTWFLPAMSLTAAWAIATAGMIALAMFIETTLPNATKVVPYLAAGFATGRLVDVPERRPKVVAAGVLAVISATGWTLFSFASENMGVSAGLTLFAVGLPVHAMGAAWAYFGMFLGQPRSAAPLEGRDEPELDELENDLRNEMTRERQAAGDEPAAERHR